MHIVFLPAWYPHRNDDMEGLFVRKHALAVAERHRVDVLFIRQEPNLKQPEFEHRVEGRLHEHYIYYPYGKRKAVRIIRFLKMFHTGFKAIWEESGKPDLIHAHVLDGVGIMALWVKFRYRIPYVVTEHWSRYLRNEFTGKIHRRIARWVARKAERIMPVSHNLQQAMLRCGFNGNYTVVSNVVDDFFFRGISSPVSTPVKTILHICCFDEAAKNNRGLLRTVKKLSETRTDFKLLMIGDGKDRAATQAYARQLQLTEDRLSFVGKLQPPEVKHALSECSFSTLFSNYENQPVVICESLSCGKPVVATQVGGIPELINDRNGLLVPPQDEDALLEALNRMLDTYTEYDPEEISHQARQMFSFEAVGKQFDDIYRQALKR
ncbi:MAG: glycosyltransferase [Bacteroides sp.]|nr:glycosyltransferase [Bacteroides sp.]